MREDLIQKSIDSFPITNKCKHGGFILPDGRMLDFAGGADVRGNHFDILKVYEDNRSNPEFDFITDTGSIRLSTTKTEISVEASLLNDITRDQLETIEDCACMDQFDGIKGKIFYDFIGKKNNKFKLVRTGELSVDVDSYDFDPDECFKLSGQFRSKFRKAQSLRLK